VKRLTTKRAPTEGAGRSRNFGTPYKPRGSWERSARSTRMIGGKPKTWGRGTGDELQQAEGVPEGTAAQSRERSHWRAGCGESRTSGSVGGGWKRAVRQRAGRLPDTSRKVAGISSKKRIEWIALLLKRKMLHRLLVGFLRVGKRQARVDFQRGSALMP